MQLSSEQPTEERRKNERRQGDKASDVKHRGTHQIAGQAIDVRENAGPESS